MSHEVLGLDLERPGPRILRTLARWSAWLVLLAGAGWTAFVEITFIQAPVDGAGVLAFLVVVPFVPYLLMALAVRWLGAGPSRWALGFLFMGALLMASSSAGALHVAFAGGVRPGSGLAFVLVPPAQAVLVAVVAGAALMAGRRHARRTSSDQPS